MLSPAPARREHQNPCLEPPPEAPLARHPQTHTGLSQAENSRLGGANPKGVGLEFSDAQARLWSCDGLSLAGAKPSPQKTLANL